MFTLLKEGIGFCFTETYSLILKLKLLFIVIPQDEGFSRPPETFFRWARGSSRRPSSISRRPKGLCLRPDGFSRRPKGFCRCPKSLSRCPKSFCLHPDGFSRRPENYFRKAVTHFQRLRNAGFLKWALNEEEILPAKKWGSLWREGHVLRRKDLPLGNEGVLLQRIQNLW